MCPCADESQAHPVVVVGATVVQEVKKSFSKQKVASSIVEATLSKTLNP